MGARGADSREVVGARARSVRLKLVGLVGLGMLSTAAVVGALLFGTAHALFLQQARSDLERQNEATGLQIEDLTDRAAAALLITRHSATFDHVFDGIATGTE